MPGPPKERNITEQYLKIESTGSIESIILATLERNTWSWFIKWPVEPVLLSSKCALEALQRFAALKNRAILSI